MNRKGSVAGEGQLDRHDPYLEAESALWRRYELHPSSRTIQVGHPPARLRVQEVGDGPPVVLVHGTGGAGAYFAPLLAQLGGFRLVVLDRPGWGLSSPIDYSRHSYAETVSGVLGDTLDALEIERAHVIGASIGDLWALRFATAERTRVERIVLLGGGPISPEISVPPFIKLLRSPLGAVITHLPERPAMFRTQLARMGHGASIDAGRIPDVFIEWHAALTRHTSWARHERDMVRAIVGRSGFVPGLVPTADEIGSIDAPILMVYGTSDPVGSIETWTRFIADAQRGRLHLVERGGHLVWLDDPAKVGSAIRRHLDEVDSG